MSEASTARERAAELEREAVTYPEDRGEIFLEAAEEWKRAGEPERAVALWREVISAGGDDAGYARYNWAEMCFEQGRDAQAWEHLRALEDAADAGVAGLVAELLAERGDDEAALRWFDRGIGALGDDEVAATGTSGAAPSIHAPLFFGRQACRRRLGLPVDRWDRVAEVADRNRVDFVRRLERTVSIVRPPLSADATTMLVWQRAERERAAARWPSVFRVETDHHQQVERRLRDVCEEHGLTKVTLVLGSADGFAAYLETEGGDPAEEGVRLAYAERAKEQGRRLVWPPGRNESCWCGSARKYKKCCGDPRSVS
ncbi:SEC-C metal-binding domain-containing protein [Rhizomonospora bruguierae]|uniref:SEC-C metal-binding domain-containing protein n=1 Tax=Rhizomonospora bruguierae TaxID=1581705 RepID=UPI001BCA744A|nr:SEC-C metal-binding domain-containing protein [Micromonospora sp. NBRC 107566]